MRFAPLSPSYACFVREDRIGVVHGFIKKTQRTPPGDLALARERMRDMLL